MVVRVGGCPAWINQNQVNTLSLIAKLIVLQMKEVSSRRRRRIVRQQMQRK